MEGITQARGGLSQVFTDTRFSPYSITNEQAPQEAYDKVVLDAGANKQVANIDGDFTTIRDNLDTRIINNFVKRTGQFINGVDSGRTPIVSWPTLASGTPYTDSDNDGMADAWENTHFGNFSRGSSANSSSDFDSDGYTDLEEYLNQTDAKVDN